MSNLVLKQSFSFLSSQDWNWDVTDASANVFTISDFINTQRFTGAFTYPTEDTISGIVTGTTYQVSQSTVYSITGMSDSAEKLANFANNTGDTQATYEYVLRGNDSIFGSSGSDILLGYGGNDSIDGAKGNDTMIGGAGNDTYYVDRSGDIVIESSILATEIDTVNSSITYTLGANVEKLTLTGSAVINGTGNAFNNTLTGNASANILSGLAGNDTINGGAGIDILIGGAGKDKLTGGLGNDRFDFNTYSEMGLGLTRDVITDFVRGQDKVDLSTIDPNAALLGNQAFTFIASTTAFSVAGQVRYSAGIIAINIDTDAATEYEIQLTGVIPAVLAATDFVL